MAARCAEREHTAVYGSARRCTVVYEYRVESSLALVVGRAHRKEYPLPSLCCVATFYVAEQQSQRLAPFESDAKDTVRSTTGTTAMCTFDDRKPYDGRPTHTHHRRTGRCRCDAPARLPSAPCAACRHARKLLTSDRRGSRRRACWGVRGGRLSRDNSRKRSGRAPLCARPLRGVRLLR